MASNPLPLIAAAAGAFFLMRATRRTLEGGGGWEEYKDPSQDDSPTPDAVSPERIPFGDLLGSPRNLWDVQKDGTSILLTGVPFDQYRFEISYPFGTGTVIASQLGDAGRYMGLRANPEKGELLVIAKNVAELKQLIKAANITGYSATLKGSSPQAQQPMTGVFPDTLVQFQFPA
jgi:hypothetical protein